MRQADMDIAGRRPTMQRACAARIDIQLLQDAAGLARQSGVAAGSQFPKLLLENLQFAEALGDVPNVFIKDGIHFAAILRRTVLKSQQDTYLVQAHVQ